MTDPTFKAEARVATEHASKYLQQLCKHFQHKLPASFAPEAGEIAFPMGPVKLAADDAALTLAVSAATPADLVALEDVVARHLVRFAFRETLEVEWRRSKSEA